MVKYPGVRINLAEEDGNAFAILANVRRAMRAVGMDELYPEFRNEATSGDYNKLLATLLEWFTVDFPEDDEDEDGW